MEAPFKVLTAYKGGVVLRSVPEGFVLRVTEGDVLMIDTAGLASKLTDVRGVDPKSVDESVNHVPPS